MSETEITEPVDALDELGRPQNFGWARYPHVVYDPLRISSPRRFASESDRYILSSPTHLVVFEILDDGCMGYAFISVVSLKDKTRSTQTYRNFFPLGSFKLPRDSDSGSAKYQQKKMSLDFTVMDEGVRIITVDIPNFGRKRSLRGKVVLSPPPEAQSLVTHMPWRGIGNAFSYSRRSPWYFAEGVMQTDTAEIVFTRETAWGIFDWNRGVRPSSDLRFWASGCGMAEDRQVGFSVGYNSADSALGTENAFFLDGKLHKLDQVSFHLPLDRHEPWRFTSNDNRLEMILSPNQDRFESHQMFLYSLKRRQLFGSFSGRVILDDGSELQFQDICGMAERRKNRL